MCKTNVKLQIISTNNFLDYVNNVDEPDDNYSQEKTVQKTFVAQIVDPKFHVKFFAMTICFDRSNCIY